MSYKEAKEDGIPYVRGFYQIPCKSCGVSIRNRSYSRLKNYICKDCKAIEQGMKDLNKAANKEKKFENAVSRIESMVGNIKPYEKAIEIVHNSLHHIGWYNSTEEIMVAIELLKNGVKAIHQQSVGKYKVDFALPDYKVLLEVDGKPFHNDLKKEGLRDGEILLKIGLEWQMIRIGTDKINKDIRKLLPSINAILEYRKNQKNFI